MVVLEAGHADRQYWHDIWHYRALFAILAWRDIAVRYKQTAIGVLWALIRPFLTMVVFTLIFGRLANLPTDGDVPYPLLVFAGMLPWYLFSSAVAGAADSIISNANLVGKVYFPRVVLPLSAIITAMIDFLISFAVLIALMVWYRYAPGMEMLLLPLFLVLAIGASLGPGLLLSALNVQYRDVRYVIPFVLQIGIYISPVGFSSALVPDEWRLLYSLNPVVGLIDGFRWCLLGGKSPLYFPGFLMSLGTAALLLWLGIAYFRNAERRFADFV